MDPTRELALTVPLARDAFFRAVGARVPEALDRLADGPLGTYRNFVQGSPDDREAAEEQFEVRLSQWLARYNLFDSDGSGWCRRLAIELLRLWHREPMAAADRLLLFGPRRVAAGAGHPLANITGWPAYTGETRAAAARRMKDEAARMLEAWVNDVPAELPMLVLQEQWGFDMLALHQCAGLSQSAILRLLQSEGHAVTAGRVSQEVARLEGFLCLRPRKRHSGGRPETFSSAL